MHLFRRLMTGLMALLVLPAMLLAQGPMPEVSADKARGVTAAPAARALNEPLPLNAKDFKAWLDGFMPYALERGRIAGAVVVVVHGNGTVLQKGYGYANVASRKPVSPDATLFRPGSISKLFTWTAVMQQVEAGKIDLDTDVNAYLDFTIPAFDGKPVTMRNIMTHTAGFEESVRYLISSDPKAAMPLQTFVKVALPERVSAPGTTPAYSNYATALAGYIVQRVSGTPFDTYIEQRIFAPLRMTRSTFRQPLPDALKPLMATGYSSVAEKGKPFEIVVPAPAGSLASTGADMGKFMIAHLNNDGMLLKPQTMRMMHDFRAPGIGPLNTMALGFYEQWVNGQRSISHGGDTEWFHSDLWLFPDADIGLYISMNSAGAEGAAQAVRSALFHKFADRYLPGSEKDGKVDDATARQHAALLAGNYVSSRGAFTNFMSLVYLLGQTTVAVDEDGKIAVPALDGMSAGARDWIEVAPFVWRDTNTGERLAAEVKDGKVVRFSIDVGSPFMVFAPAPAGLNAVWLLPALLLSLGIVLLAALAWPVRAIVRRSYGQRLALEGRSRIAYRLSRGFAWAALAAAAGWMGFIAAFSADLGAVGGPLDWLIILLRIVTPLAALGLVASSGWLLWLAFQHERRWTAKCSALLLLFAGLVLLWVVIGTHLYGFSMVY